MGNGFQFPPQLTAKLLTDKCAKHDCKARPTWRFSFVFQTQFGPLPLMARECAVCDAHRRVVETDLLPAFATAFQDVEVNGQRIHVDLAQSRCVFEPLPAVH